MMPPDKTCEYFEATIFLFHGPLAQNKTYILAHTAKKDAYLSSDFINLNCPINTIYLVNFCGYMLLFYRYNVFSESSIKH